MKTSIILFSFFASFFVRAMRWLSIVQQKEYRFDRLMLFINTSEGRRELFRLIPKKNDFSRTGLKRPKITSRIAIVLLIFFLEMLLLIFFMTTRILLNIESIYIAILFLLMGLGIILLLIPLFIFIAIFPTTFISFIRILMELVIAKSKVDKIRPVIIGITGSYGKTSTKIVLANVLEKKFSVFKTPKSHNTKFSIARSINQGFKNQQIMIIEYAAYKKGEIKTIASWFKPTMAIITGLANQHLGLFGNIQSVILAKAELVKSLEPGSKVICNGDDPGTTKIYEAAANENIKMIKANDENENSLIIKAHLNKSGHLIFVWQGLQVSTNFMGMHYLEIIRMVIVVAKEFGLSNEEIVDALSTFVPDDKFIFSYKLNSGTLIIDDGGTSNPKGFSAAIKLSAEIENEKKILITSGIVDLGAESEKTHQYLAKESVKVFDKVLYVSESGKANFSSIFENNLIEERSEIIDFLTSLNGHEMILVEGKMPGWIVKYLK